MRSGWYVSDGAVRVISGLTETAVVDTAADGVARLTLDLRLGIDHVHCYALKGSDGFDAASACWRTSSISPFPALRRSRRAMDPPGSGLDAAPRSCA
jgi:hypothetical protein